MGYVRALVPNKSDAEEILQEVNLYICRHADEFQADTNFAAWAIRIAHFTVLAWRERQTRDRLVFDDSILERLATVSASFDMQDDRRQAALETCLEKLTSREHVLITQFYGGQD